MKKKWATSLLFATLCTAGFSQVGKVGINTSSPAAMLHVRDSSVLFSSTYYENIPEYDTPPPVSGAGVRLFWYPQRQAFRAGYVQGTQWDHDNIGFLSFATGQNTRAMGKLSSAFGFSTIANGYSSFSVGVFNDPIEDPEEELFPWTPLFIVGNGDDNINRSNALVALKSGRIGIGTNTPAARLHVESESVLFNGPPAALGMPGAVPASGVGTRMMWYADKAAFRVGEVNGTTWDKDSIGYHSFAAGVDTKAKGNKSTAFGFFTEATNQYATAMGFYSKASGYNAMAIGNITVASGHASTAMGSSTIASGDYSTAMGSTTTASGNYATSLGRNTIASNAYSTAMGYITTASGSYSTSLGSQTIASGTGAIAAGYGSEAMGSTAFAFGFSSSATGDYSVAGGYQSTTNGLYNFAFGYNATTSGESAIALGHQASGTSGIAIGNNANASALNALALGDHAHANGSSSVAIGKYASTGNEDAIALGATTNASGYRSMALGYNCTASAPYSTAMGISTMASGDFSFTIGASTKAKGSYSCSSGIQTIAKSFNSFIIGRYNDTTSVSSTTWVETDPLLIVGNGTANNDRKNAMTLLKNGKMGLGTVSPVNLLHLRAANDTINGPILSLGGTSSDQAESGRIRFYEGTASTNLRGGYIHLDGSANRFHIGIHPTTDNIVSNDLPAITIDRVSGEVGIGTVNPGYLLEVNGTAGKPGGGSWTNTSDARLKQNVLPYTDGLQSILSINPVRFQYNERSGYDTSEEYVGVIAQELNTIAPYMIHTSDRVLPDGTTGYLEVDNSAMTYMLINAVKEQQIVISSQQQRIDDLEKELQTIKAMLIGITQK